MQIQKNTDHQALLMPEEAEKALLHAVTQVRKYIPDFYDFYPASASKNNFYPQTENNDWTNGFWTGEIWLSYEKTGDEFFKDAARHQVKDFYRRIQEKIVVDNHDMGFLYSPSCVAAYKLTGDETGKKAALSAAENLLTRFQEKGEFFQAWGELGAPDNYRMIIDCLMNMPLLFWASDVTGEEKFKIHAEKHIKTCLKYIVREDASTYHTFFFDPQTGEPLRGVTAQGNTDSSIWSRGQAWGIYGTAISYKYLRDPVYLEIFRKVTKCFIEHLPTDLVPYWDFDFSDGSEEPRDSSAGAIACCGMLEMIKYMEKEEADYYRTWSLKIMKALTDHCLYKDTDNTNGILLHSTYAKSSPGNTVEDNGVDECCPWGDYFYMESLTRILGDWKTYW